MENGLSSSLHRELHRLAVGKMRFERGNYTLQPTALVNEAYLPLVGESDSIRQDRSRVLGLAAKIIPHILIDYARAHLLKRGKMDGCMSHSSKIKTRRQPI
jgi:RNA polymerase sigma-70 factor (ECF subfamily)